MTAATDRRLTFFGEHLRAHRASQGLTQDELAAKVGLKRSSIANMEAGRQSPPLVVALDIATVLGTPLGALIGEIDDPIANQMVEVLADIARLEEEAATAQVALRDAKRKAAIVGRPRDTRA